MNNIYKVLLFILVLIVVDTAIGFSLNRLYLNSLYGIYGRQIEALDDFNDDLLILGSSRAAHHYNPEIFEEELNLSAFNAGSDGMCIYYHYAILNHIIHSQDKPKIILLDVIALDVAKSTGATFSLEAALNRLKPHYGKSNMVDELFSDIKWNEKIALSSSMYRYNSQILQILSSNFISDNNYKGYSPLYKTQEINKIVVAEDEIIIDELKLSYLTKTIQLCLSHNIPLILCYSPSTIKPNENFIRVIEELSLKYGVPFYNLFTENIQKYSFQDDTHLNAKGADIFTKDLISLLPTIR